MGDHWYKDPEGLWRRGDDTVESSPAGGWTLNGLPLSGQILYGACTEGGNTQAGIEETESRIGMTGAEQFGEHRMFFAPGSYANAIAGGAASVAAESIAAGRIPWISLKVPDNDWVSAASGALDADMVSLASQFEALDGPVWIAFHHEPEGDGNPSDWIAMQRRLLTFFDSVENVATTTIVTGYNQTYGYAGQTWDTFWTGGTGGYVPDIFGYDPYNFYKSYWNGTTWSWTELGVNVTPHSKNGLDSLQAWYDQQPDVENMYLGIAETGDTDAGALTPENYYDSELGYTVCTEGPGSEWMQRQMADIRANHPRMIVVNYFDLNTMYINNATHQADILAAALSCDLYEES